MYLGVEHEEFRSLLRKLYTLMDNLVEYLPVIHGLSNSKEIMNDSSWLYSYLVDHNFSLVINGNEYRWFQADTSIALVTDVCNRLARSTKYISPALTDMLVSDLTNFTSLVADVRYTRTKKGCDFINSVIADFKRHGFNVGEDIPTFITDANESEIVTAYVVEHTQIYIDVLTDLTDIAGDMEPWYTPLPFRRVEFTFVFNSNTDMKIPFYADDHEQAHRALHFIINHVVNTEKPLLIGDGEQTILIITPSNLHARVLYGRK